MAPIDLSVFEPEIRELLPLFLEGSRGRLESLEGLLAEKRFEDIRRLGHGLKGTSAMYQLDEFAELGKALEHAAMSADEEAIAQCGRAWRSGLDALASVLT